MEKQLELQRQLDIEHMELHQRLARAEAEERVAQSTIMSLKSELFKLKASIAVQHQLDIAYHIHERNLEDLRLRIRDEKQRLLDIQTRRRETKIGGEYRIAEFQREIEIERSKDRFQSFMGRIGLVRK